PLSSTGRISDGRRLIGISALHRGNKTRSRTWSRRLQIYFEHLELDGDRWRRHKRPQSVFRLVGHRPEALYKTPANAIGDLGIAIFYSTVMQVTALELVRLVRRE